MTPRQRAEQAWHDVVGLCGSLVIDAVEQAIAAARVEALEEAAKLVEHEAAEFEKEIGEPDNEGLDAAAVASSAAESMAEDIRRLKTKAAS